MIEDLTKQMVKLSMEASVQDSTGPVGRLLFNALPIVPEFESDLIRAHTRLQVTKAKGRPRGQQPKPKSFKEPTSCPCIGHAITEIAEPFKVARPTVYPIRQQTPYAP
nr:hypothetical protein [Arthrobacter crusticola]